MIKTNQTSVYESPAVEVLTLMAEGDILIGSPTGEDFNDQEDYGGTWA